MILWIECVDGKVPTRMKAELEELYMGFTIKVGVMQNKWLETKKELTKNSRGQKNNSIRVKNNDDEANSKMNIFISIYKIIKYKNFFFLAL